MRLKNTISAFKNAVSLGPDIMAEFDVQRTSDGEPIVIHDEYLPGRKKRIKDPSSEELDTYNASFGKDRRISYEKKF